MTDEITNQDAQYALDIVKRICTEVGPGLPATPEERARAEVIKNELETHLGAGNVEVEEFTLAPGAFLGSQLISTLFMLIAGLLNISMGRFPGVSPWVTTIAALAFSILSVLLFIFEFVIGFELVDPFFKKKGSINVVGKLCKPGCRNVKRLLILSGHHDSALEFTWLRFTGYGFFIVTVTWMIGLITVLMMSVIQLAGVITGNTDLVRIGTLGWVLMAYPIGPRLSLHCSLPGEGKTEALCQARRIISQPARWRWRCAGSWWKIHPAFRWIQRSALLPSAARRPECGARGVMCSATWTN